MRFENSLARREVRKGGERDVSLGIEPATFRAALGRFASGVTVITTAVGEDVFGMTASAFMSVSLEPPLVLVSVDRRANMHSYLQQTKRYGVSVLSIQQRVHSNHFAGWEQPDFEPEFRWLNGVPVLAGAISTLTTKVANVHEAGDHSLFVGEVTHLNFTDEAPLLYFSGKYGALRILD